MRQAEFTIHTLADLVQAASLALRFAAGRKKFAISGDLGAGKTAFVKACCQQLGVDDPVTSPSFSLVNCYSLGKAPGESSSVVHHLDLYRLRTVEEAQDMGIESYLYDPAYCFIEWPGLIADYLPEDVVFVEISLQPDATRKMTLACM